MRSSPSSPKTDVAVVHVLAAFTGFLWVLLAPTAVAYLHHDAPEHAPTAVFSMLLGTSMLLAYLLLPAPRRLLPRRFLPVALGLLTLIPLLGEVLSLRSGETAVGKFLLEYAFVIVAPVFVCAWQFGMRPALVIVLVGTVADFSLSFHAPAFTAEVFRHMVFSRAAVLIAAAYITTRLVNAQRAQYNSLCVANAKLASHALTLEQLATSRERNRIAREIHDTLAHTLSALSVQLEAIRTVSPSAPEEAKGMLDRALATTRNGLRETRRTLQALRASPIDDLGLALALRQRATDVVARTDAELKLTIPDESPPLPPDIEHGLYRIAEESLENVIRHADAHHIELGLTVTDGQASVWVRDDGCGFDPNAGNEGTYGLWGMRERAKLLNGRLIIDSALNTGTTVRFTVQVPFDPSPAAGGPR